MLDAILGTAMLFGFLAALAWPPTRLALGLLGIYMGLLSPPDYWFTGFSAIVAGWGAWAWARQADEPRQRKRWNAREREIIRHLPIGDYPVAVHLENDEYLIRGSNGWMPVRGTERETAYGGLVQYFERRDVNGRRRGLVRAEHHPFDGKTPNVRPGSRLHWLLFHSPEGDYFQRYQTKQDVGD